MSLSFPTSPSVGQAYQGWKWNGNAWDPNYAANFVTSINGKTGALGPTDVPGVGQRVLIMSQAVSATPVASVNFLYTFTNQYDEYELTIYDGLTADGALFAMRCSYDGSTFDSAATSYPNAFLYIYNVQASGVNGAFVGATQPFIQLGQYMNGNTAQVITARVYFAMPWSTTRNKYFRYDVVGQSQANGAMRHSGSCLWYTASGSQSNPLRGLQVLANTGNVVRGVFNLYGIVKSGTGATGP